MHPHTGELKSWYKITSFDQVDSSAIVVLWPLSHAPHSLRLLLCPTSNAYLFPACLAGGKWCLTKGCKTFMFTSRRCRTLHPSLATMTTIWITSVAFWGKEINLAQQSHHWAIWMATAGPTSMLELQVTVEELRTTIEVEHGSPCSFRYKGA